METNKFLFSPIINSLTPIEAVSNNHSSLLFKTNCTLIRHWIRLKLCTMHQAALPSKNCEILQIYSSENIGFSTWGLLNNIGTLVNISLAHLNIFFFFLKQAVMIPTLSYSSCLKCYWCKASIGKTNSFQCRNKIMRVLLELRRTLIISIVWWPG